MDVARKVGGAIDTPTSLIPIAKLYQSIEITDDSAIIGFVFPIYMGDAPWVVKEVVKKIHFSHNSYIYAVATCNGNPRNCLSILSELIKMRAQTLAFSDAIVMPGNAKISPPEVNEAQFIV